MTQPTECPLCGVVAPRVCNRTHVDGETTYTLYGCDACAVEFWWPLQNPGAEWYAHDVRYAERNTDPVWNASWNHKKVISYLAPMKGSVLDVGCGIGNFLAWAKQEGWSCTGIDFDPDAIEAAKKRFGLTDVQVMDIRTYAQQNQGKRFDLVTFFDVLEHVDNHNEFIETISGLLNKGGYVAMSMPYRKHAEWLMPGDLPPRHLTRWDRRALTTFLEAHGFRVVYMTRRSEGIWNIVIRLRFMYGKRLSVGAVRAVRQSLGDVGTSRKGRPFIVKVVHMIAKIKDAVFFGIPAVCIWICMLPLPSRYPTLYAVAQKKA